MSSPIGFGGKKSARFMSVGADLSKPRWMLCWRCCPAALGLPCSCARCSRDGSCEDQVARRGLGAPNFCGARSFPCCGVNAVPPTRPGEPIEWSCWVAEGVALLLGARVIRGGFAMVTRVLPRYRWLRCPLWWGRVALWSQEGLCSAATLSCCKRRPIPEPRSSAGCCWGSDWSAGWWTSLA